MSREVYLWSDISDKYAGIVVSELLRLDADSEEPIILFINSDGGTVLDALAIYDIIRLLKSDVFGIVVGRAYSSAVLVLQACDSRLATESARLMLHEGSMGVEEGSPSETAKSLREDLRLMDTADRIIAARTKLTLKQVKSLARDVTYMSGGAALKVGLIDGIMQSSVGNLRNINKGTINGPRSKN